jgi:hypothetical protein
MNDLEKRVARLELALQRMLDLISRMNQFGTRMELELLKQYVQGKLEPNEIDRFNKTPAK